MMSDQSATKQLKSILRHQFSAQNTAHEGNQKIQRVRFDESVHEELYVMWAVGLGGRIWSPDSSFHATWMTVMLIPMTWETWAFAFRFALCLPAALRQQEQLDWVDAADIFCDVLFICDGIMQCVTSQPEDCHEVPRRQSVPQTEKMRSQNAARYFRRVFPLELLPSTFFWAASLQCDAGQYIWLWWLSMLLRAAPRSSRLYSYFSKIAMNLSIDIYALQIFKFGLYIYMSVHYIGCIFFWLAMYYPQTIGGDPVYQEQARDNTWIAHFERHFPPFQLSNSSIGEKYLVCLYRGTLGGKFSWQSYLIIYRICLEDRRSTHDLCCQCSVAFMSH